MDRMMLQNEESGRYRMGGIYRRYRRGTVSGFSGDIADGNRIIGGVVEDVSPNGFKMSHIDETFLAEEHTYYAVVSGKGRHYKLLAKPCWKRSTETGLEIGFKIVDASWEWTEFILDTVPEDSRQNALSGNA